MFVILVPLLATLLIFIVAHHQFIKVKPRCQYVQRLPPGSFGLPLIGDTITFVSCWKNKQMSKYFQAKTKRYGPVFKASLFGRNTVLLSALEGKSFIYRNDKLMESAWPNAQILLGQNFLFYLRGDDHKQRKRVLSAPLQPEAIQGFVADMSRAAMDHLDKFWAAGKTLRVYEDLSVFMLNLHLNLLTGFSMPNDEMQALSHDLDTLIRGLFTIPMSFPGSSFMKAKIARKKIDQALSKYIEKKKEDLQTKKSTSNQDILSIILTTAIADGMPNVDGFVKDSLVGLLVSSHTPRTTLSMAFKYLAENIHCMDKVVQEQAVIQASKNQRTELSWDDVKEMSYTWKVIQETLRMSPTCVTTFRKTMADLEYGGYTIPQGWQVVSFSSHENFDPEYFHDPGTFNPSRFDNEYPLHVFVPFGAGGRVCTGIQFSKAEMLIFLHYCILKYQWTLVDPFEKIEMAVLPRPVKGLPIRINNRRNIL